MIRVFGAAFWFEATANSRTYGQWIPVITAPFYTAIFLAITGFAGRDDLAGYAVVAPALIGCGATPSSKPGDHRTREIGLPIAFLLLTHCV